MIRRSSTSDFTPSQPAKAPTGDDLQRGLELGSIPTPDESDRTYARAYLERRAPDLIEVLGLDDRAAAKRRRRSKTVPGVVACRAIRCPDCEARPGAKCTTRAGTPAVREHGARVRLWKERRQ